MKLFSSPFLFRKDEAVQQIIEYLNNIVSNEDYIDDIKVINYLLFYFNDFIVNPQNIKEDLLDYVDNKIIYLDQKYDDLYDLVNMYDPIKIECKNNLHKKYVENLRKENRKKKKYD